MTALKRRMDECNIQQASLSVMEKRREMWIEECRAGDAEAARTIKNQCEDMGKCVKETWKEIRFEAMVEMK